VAPITGVPSGVIGRRPDQKLAPPGRRRPETGCRPSAPACAPAHSAAVVEAGDLGHAADPDAVAQPGDGHLVGLVQQGRDRRAAASTIGAVIE
jgi:hypothetical protein